MQLFHIDTRWACGGIFVSNGIVVGGAPIFKKFIGQSIASLKRAYLITEVRGAL